MYNEYLQDNSTAEKILKITDYGLKTPHLPSRISSLHGILYLLEAGIQEMTKFIIPLATDFLLKNLSSVNQWVMFTVNVHVQYTLIYYTHLLVFWGSSYSYVSWIYNYLCNQCLSPLKLWDRILFMARCTRYNIMW